MDWVGSATSAALSLTANNTTAQYIVLPSEVQEQFTDPTLIRTRGQLIIVAQGNGSDMVGACGLIEWPDNNDTPPVAADAPSPLVPSHDWIWHTWFFAPSGTAMAYQASLGAPGGQNIDSKAMRRLGARKGILFVTSLLAGSPAITYMFGFRCLLKD